ncbi:hypothetical protein HMPREF9248_0822 [Fannyhessea vaginae PB189-T1-4]|uniref:Uncharacterized protein n=1 Tax=Fannyhessea vaginae PB189-T1-4 TaxID=866774 RepID=A0ABN0AZR1_9ACTN|nr:hypothetical protein HMPREF9248_0822 [Fannyhessea vaginae PB189-T1-4]
MSSSQQRTFFIQIRTSINAKLHIKTALHYPHCSSAKRSAHTRKQKLCIVCTNSFAQNEQIITCINCDDRYFHPLNSTVYRFYCNFLSTMNALVA